jgi:hypothetical protein
MLMLQEARSARAGLGDFFRNHPHPNLTGLLVSVEHKFIYMKIGKTAGTSIFRKHLQARVPGIIFHKEHPEKFNDWLSRVTDEELKEYFIFTVVRNPWDRFVSLVSYFGLPFRDFARDFEGYLDRDVELKQHALPCHWYTHNNGVQFVDFICRFECVQADYNLVCDRLGLERTRLSHSNRSDHKHYSRYYGPEEVQLIADAYAKDIEYFGYEFEQAPPEPARPAPSVSLLERGVRGVYRRLKGLVR